MRSSLDSSKKLQSFYLNNPKKLKEYYNFIQSYLLSKKTFYKDKLVEFVCEPFFIDKTLEKRFIRIVETMDSIVKKVTLEYLKNPLFRKQFPFTEMMKEMILVDPGYSNPAPIGRFDIFWDENNFKFCELNGDGTSAMNEANNIDKALLKVLAAIFPDSNFDNYELFESWLSELLSLYKEFGGKKSKPNIAIVDFDNLGTTEEFTVFKNCFEKKGFQTVIADPRQLKYKNKKLFFNDIEIDLIYRRAVNKEMEIRIDEIEDFYKAYKENSVCVVGPFRSQIMHNKAFFAILHNKNNNHIFTKKELDFIAQHIPQTFFLNNKENLLRVTKNKDSYVVKPLDKYAGKDVRIGLDYSKTDWKKVVTSAYKTKQYIGQVFCNPPKIQLLNRNGKLDLFNTTIGLFVYNGKFKGLYHRVGRKNVIAGISEAIVRACITTF